VSLHTRQIHDHIGLPLLPLVQKIGLKGLPVDEHRRDLMVLWVGRQLDELACELADAGIVEPGSGKKLGDALINLGVPLSKKTAGGQSVTDLDVLRRFNFHYNEVVPNPKFPFLKPVIKWKKLEKLRGNLESMRLCDDHRLRTSLRSTGTETGRYSSSRLKWCSVCRAPFHGTNLQNLSKADEVAAIDCRGGCWLATACETHQHYLRDCIVARPGMIFIERDYSMLELRILAELANVPLLLARLAAYDAGTGLSIHTMNEQDLFSTDGPNRTLAKNFAFACVYGGGPVAIQIALAKKGIYLSIARIEQLQQKLFAIYPEIIGWQIREDEYIRRARAASQLIVARNAFGRARIMLGSEPLKELLSTKVQGAAGDVMSFVLLRIAREALALLDTLCSQVHDAYVAEVPVKTADAYDTQLTQAMERPVWMGSRFVVFPAEGKRGTCLGDMRGSA